MPSASLRRAQIRVIWRCWEDGISYESAQHAAAKLTPTASAA
ncbi:hypothetical protein [uncultured Mycobacterium sp.]